MNKIPLLSYFDSQRILDFLQLMRADKPIGTLLLLWPTTWALWLSGGERSGGEISFIGTEAWRFVSMDPQVVLVFLFGVFFMRSAGCVINDFADKDLDRHVQRTADRPLTSGRLSSFDALSLFFVLCFLSLALVLTLDQSVRVSVLYAAIPALLIAVAYPFMKRFFVTPQLVLGIAFSCGIPMAFLAHGKQIELGCYLLILANIAWVVAYDTIYAMVDQEDDEKIGILSSSRFFSDNVSKAIACLQVFTLMMLVAVGFVYQLNASFYLTIAFSSFYFIYQHYLIKDRKRSECFAAFLNNSWFGATVLLAIIIGSQNGI